MAQVIVMIVFLVALPAGSVIAALAGWLPTAKQLAEEDEARFALYKRALES